MHKFPSLSWEQWEWKRFDDFEISFLRHVFEIRAWQRWVSSFVSHVTSAWRQCVKRSNFGIEWMTRRWCETSSWGQTLVFENLKEAGFDLDSIHFFQSLCGIWIMQEICILTQCLLAKQSWKLSWNNAFGEHESRFNGALYLIGHFSKKYILSYSLNNCCCKSFKKS